MSRWSIPLDKLAKAAGEDIERVGRRATFELYRAIVLRSPVDTGRFRANWNFAISSPDSATTQSLNAATADAQAAKALAQPLGGVVYFTNSLPYATRLEYGYSDQAPGGMVRLTLREWREHVRKAIAATT